VDAVFWRAFNDLLIAMGGGLSGCRPNGEDAIDSWHATFLGLRHLPREVTAFEIEALSAGRFSAPNPSVLLCPW
jgi:hypothetical protein